MRVREEGGFLMVEVTAAIVVLSIALLGLMAGYDSAFVSLHRSGQQSEAASLAEQQLERIRALPLTSVGLNSTLVANVGDPNNAAYDSLYASNDFLTTPDPKTGLTGIAADYTTPACSGDTTTPTCLPIQASVLGPDGRHYRIETFVRESNHGSNKSWVTRDIAVVVRDADSSSLPQLTEEETAFYVAPGG